MAKQELFSQRMGRWEFFTWEVTFVIVMFIVSLAIREALSLLDFQSDVPFIAEFFFLAGMLITLVFLVTKRLHDFDCSAWWVLLG
jgi:uncharacterized membrane protein YhaH (DUF805 family)